MSTKIIIYTDGASRGNPGPGGYGVILMSGTHKKELSEGYKLTTNNRMELLAVIVALESLKKDNCDVTIYTDSKYVVDSVEKKWVFGWKRNGFKGKKNADLWLRFLSVYKNHNVIIKWVKGHSENAFNERCDILAVNAALGHNLLVDNGYEDSKIGKEGLF